jgi:hypothetical protein
MKNLLCKILFLISLRCFSQDYSNIKSFDNAMSYLYKKETKSICKFFGLDKKNDFHLKISVERYVFPSLHLIENHFKLSDEEDLKISGIVSSKVNFYLSDTIRFESKHFFYKSTIDMMWCSIDSLLDSTNLLLTYYNLKPNSFFSFCEDNEVFFLDRSIPRYDNCFKSNAYLIAFSEIVNGYCAAIIVPEILKGSLFSVNLSQSIPLIYFFSFESDGSVKKCIENRINIRRNFSGSFLIDFDRNN